MNDAAVNAEVSATMNANTVSVATLTATTITRVQVEDFLIEEAALLDAWRLDDWLGLLTDDARYRVPSNDAPESAPADALFLIADDARRIRERVLRLKDRNAHAEFPHSRTRRMISNVRILPRSADVADDADDTLDIEANFVVYRHRRHADVRCYVGVYRHRLCIVDGRLRIAQRTAVLDAHELGALGLLSFIL